jgi:GNAT superfamily N-acetyltransferase
MRKTVWNLENVKLRLISFLPVSVIKNIITKKGETKNGRVEYKIMDKIIFYALIDKEFSNYTIGFFGFKKNNTTLYYIQKKLEGTGFGTKILQSIIKDIEENGNGNDITLVTSIKNVYNYNNPYEFVGFKNNKDLYEKFYKKNGFIDLNPSDNDIFLLTYVDSKNLKK